MESAAVEGDLILLLFWDADGSQSQVGGRFARTDVSQFRHTPAKVAHYDATKSTFEPAVMLNGISEEDISQLRQRG